MKTIKFLTAAFAATAMLAACSEEKAAPTTDSPEPITFVLDDEASATRAQPITGTNLNGKSFGLYSSINSGGYTSFFANQKADVAADGTVTLAGSPWYWPVSGSTDMSFFGIYPYNATPATASNGLKYSSTAGTPNMTVTYAMQPTFANQQDILITHKNVTTGTSTVPLKFFHALTRVTFQFKVTANPLNNEVKVTKIKFNKVYTGERSFTITKSFDETAVAASPATAAPIASWSGSATVGSLEVNIGTTNAKPYSTTTSDADADTPNSGTSGYTNVFIDAVKDNSFIMFPTLASTLADSSIEVTLSVGGVSKGPYTINTVNQQEWTSGSHINYRLACDVTNTLTPITISAVTVHDWVKKTDIDVTVPIP